MDSFPEFNALIEPRFVIKNAASETSAAALAASLGKPVWTLRCQFADKSDQSLFGLYGKPITGQISVADTQQFIAVALVSRTVAATLDNTRPGKRHVSFAIGAALVEMLMARKEIIQSGCLVLDVCSMMVDDGISHLEEFFTALLVRSARPTYSNAKLKLEPQRIELYVLLADSSAQSVQTQEFQACALASAQIVAEAMMWTRSLVNAPSNLLRPDSYEKIIERMVGELTESAADGHASVRVEVIKDDALLEANCRLIHAVGRGSSVAPRIIKLSHRGAAEFGAPQRPRISLVGKGITFDSGGYDLKPSAGMRNMKKDMGGSAVVVGVFWAVVKQNLAVDLDAYLCLAENMVSGDAFRPGDVILARDGTLVEIENTDAEGRLVLADALHMAAESSPDWIIDFATLTGAARVALGPDVDALFANESDKALLFASSGIETGDWVWHLPRVPGYQKLLESTVGDTLNASATGHGGALTAALFLERFVGRIPWTHVDTYMWADKPGSLTASEPGATSKCVRLVLEVLRRYLLVHQGSSK
jgi:leucyl aminopeptidase